MHYRFFHLPSAFCPLPSAFILGINRSRVPICTVEMVYIPILGITLQLQTIYSHRFEQQQTKLNWGEVGDGGAKSKETPPSLLSAPGVAQRN